jgi:choline dehydrogenase-like flavoprotein
VDGTTPTATGIQLDRFGRKLTLKAKKEVVLSAGAIGSPQLLLLSGIGPKADLESVGVEVVKDVPGVGRNLQDHLMAGFAFTVPKAESEKSWTGLSPFDVVNPLRYFRYLTSGTGSLANSGISIGAFIHSGLSTDSRPDVQLHTFPGLLTMDFDLAFRKAGNIADDAYEGLLGDYKES